jgi:GNAT superfamily N-acetyltransferase
MRIESIADHLHFVETIARWHYTEWGHCDPAGSLASWTQGLRGRTNRDRIPTTFVALDEDELLGSVTLVEHDMGTHLDLSPWLAGLYVKPSQRGRGVATALVTHAVREATEMGIDRLYLHTHSARGLYEKLGWRPVTADHYEGQDVIIMRFDLRPAEQNPDRV